jgi:isochorismate hydrolase
VPLTILDPQTALIVVDLIPELHQQPDDILITKRTWGAFANTDLEAQLKAKGVRAWKPRRAKRSKRVSM